MQRDKAKKRESLANPWWEFFRFSLEETLINEADGSIYGPVFKYDNYQNTSTKLMAPRYVIAFRGTLLSFKTGLSDLIQDIRCILHNLDGGKRFEHAIQAINTVLTKQNSETRSVWLAGHSLGAGIALLAGKKMAGLGFPLETYAFNPPHSFLPMEQMFDSNVLKGGLRITNCFIKATVAAVFDHPIQEDNPRIAAWIPHLYVNPADIVCSEYIGDFKYKNVLSNIGLSTIESAGASISFRSLLFGGESGEGTSLSPSAEPIQRLQSADMIVNCNESTDFKTAHGVKQWWKLFMTIHGLTQWWELFTTTHELKQRWKLFMIVHGIKQWWEPDPVRRANWESHSMRPSSPSSDDDTTDDDIIGKTGVKPSSDDDIIGKTGVNVMVEDHDPYDWECIKFPQPSSSSAEPIRPIQLMSSDDDIVGKTRVNVIEDHDPNDRECNKFPQPSSPSAEPIQPIQLMSSNDAIAGKTGVNVMIGDHDPSDRECINFPLPSSSSEEPIRPIQLISSADIIVNTGVNVTIEDYDPYDWECIHL